MIKGLGMDMMEVARMGEKLARRSGFREHVFSPAEITYCDTRANPNEHYAARFAAKEAFFKALGTGWLKGTAFNEVEVVHDEQGRPLLVLLGETKETVAGMGNFRLSLTITHTSTMAAATVIIEQ